MGNEIKELYKAFLRTNKAQGSGAVDSYPRAMDKATQALLHTNLLDKGETLWDIRDAKRLHNIRLFVLAEAKKGPDGIFRNEEDISYYRDNYCSASILNFIAFLPVLEREDLMIEAVSNIDNPKKIAKKLISIEIPNEKKFIESLKSKKGKEVVREIKTRQNQHVFRKMILGNYHNRCCLSGLPIREVLRASHISPWAEDEKNRLNPENGLCLAATYDAAFDRYLISFDEDYRLILSPALKEFYQDEAFKRDFKTFEGKRIEMPTRFKPSQKLLEKHRERLLE